MLDMHGSRRCEVCTPYLAPMGPKETGSLDFWFGAVRLRE
jgi:hypothetical protein